MYSPHSQGTICTSSRCHIRDTSYSFLECCDLCVNCYRALQVRRWLVPLRFLWCLHSFKLIYKMNFSFCHIALREKSSGRGDRKPRILFLSRGNNWTGQQRVKIISRPAPRLWYGLIFPRVNPLVNSTLQGLLSFWYIIKTNRSTSKHWIYIGACIWFWAHWTRGTLMVVSQDKVWLLWKCSR